MSIFYYNGITLPYPFATSFSQQSVSDPSGTDLTGYNFDITVQSLLNSKYIATIDPSIPAGSNPATIMQTIRTKLMERRGEMQYTFNGVDLIPALPSTNLGFVDVNNGPVPQYCNISMLTDDTFVISYRISATYWQSSGDAYPVLNNRWTESVEIDRHNYSTYTRTGTYIIRSDNPQGQSVEGVTGNTASGPGSTREQFAVVGIRPGCYRHSAAYTVSPDGLRMQYTITDKEIAFQPPAPAFQAIGFYVETSPSKFNAQRQGMAYIKLIGDKGSGERSQAALVSAAVLACYNKLSRGGAARNANYVFAGGNVRMAIYENEVEVTMHSLLSYTPQPNAPIIVKGGMPSIHYPTLLNNQDIVGSKPPPHAVRGTAGIVLQAAAYYDPNVKSQLTATTGQMSAGLVPGQEGQKG